MTRPYLNFAVFAVAALLVRLVQPACAATQSAPAAASPAPAAVAAVAQMPTAEQLFSDSIGRDPFVPVKRASPVEIAARPAPSASASGKAFSIYRLELSGLVVFGSVKQAIMYDSETSEPYYLRDGRIFDRKRRLVPGVTGEVEGRRVLLSAGKRDSAVLSMAQDAQDSAGAKPARKAAPAKHKQEQGK
jgi:hypothetical protein